MLGLAAMLVETILCPLTSIFANTPFDTTYTGSSVWSLAVLSTLTLRADYTGTEDAKSSDSMGAFNTTAAATLALTSLEGSTTDELKACIVTLYALKLGVFRGIQGLVSLRRGGHLIDETLAAFSTLCEDFNKRGSARRSS